MTLFAGTPIREPQPSSRRVPSGLVRGGRWLGVALALSTAAAMLPGCTPHARYTSSPGEAGAAPDRPRHATGSSSSADSTAVDRRLESAVASYLGTPYRYGGSTRAGMDCSGFVRRIYLEVYKKGLPRTSREIARTGRPVSRERARPGDIVVFRRGGVGRVDHVGIYLGDGRFAHASRSSGVIRSSLDDEYHGHRFSGMRRITP